jgi:hypothetical protein
MRYAISVTNALAERRSHPNLMHFRNYALLPYALLQFRLYRKWPPPRPWPMGFVRAEDVVGPSDVYTHST